MKIKHYYSFYDLVYRVQNSIVSNKRKATENEWSTSGIYPL